MGTLLALLICSVVTIATCGSRTTYEWETWLQRNLTDPEIYDINVRPAVNGTNTVRVSFGLALINIFSVLWRDARLKWDHENYDGIDHTHIPANLIWTPDTFLYNSVDGQGRLRDDESMAVVSSDGTVLYIPRVSLSGICSFDMTWFPYDQQTCNLKIGSWTYDGFKLDLDFYDGLRDMDLTDFSGHTEWDIVEHDAQKNVKYYPCCPEPYPDLSFTLSLKRRSSYFTQMYVVPGVILALVTPFIFALPVNKPHRYMLGVGLMISTAIFTSNLHGVIPDANGTPMLGRFFTVLQAVVAVALVLSATVSNLAEKSANGHQPPSLIKKIVVDGLGRLLCIDRGLLRRSSMDDEEKTESKPCSAQWYLVARVLDRLFFIVYCAMLLLILILCFTK